MSDSNLETRTCIVKSIPKHWRLRNEADILKRYQDRSPFLRPLVDEIEEPSEPASIVLQYMDADLLNESNKTRLTRPEIKHVAKTVLEVLKMFHEEGLVHTGTSTCSILPSHEYVAVLTFMPDVKLDNIFVDRGKDGQRFSAIKIGDFGGVVPETSEFARRGHLIGAVINRSPESMLAIRWGTATDIWSFGTCVSRTSYPFENEILDSTANHGCA